ncbi:MAG: hypothetical protein GY927_18875 [bacterium]|nr:hypothetical protein [bacterium]
MNISKSNLTRFVLSTTLATGLLWTLYNRMGTTLGEVQAFLATRLSLSYWMRVRTGQKLEQLIKSLRGSEAP